MHPLAIGRGIGPLNLAVNDTETYRFGHVLG